ncbi:MAG: peptidase T [Lachnospiraceae bacterium]|nr:peptidase T [Lachnospiraceae bacterium]
MKVDERFLKYVAFDTTSDEESETSPSSPNQAELGRFIRAELERLGVEGAVLSDTGYVYGWLPASEGCEDLPCIGLIAHMDTSDGACGADIKPRYLKYEGGDIVLNERVTTSVQDFPFLNDMIGQTLIVTDGTTLLGADDKAGVAEIVTLAEYLLEHPEVKHGRIAVAFTPDEEIGRGTDHFDVEGFGADFAYTVDGGLLGELEYENFNAAGGRETFHGTNIHPGSAKNKMKNSVTVAADFLRLFPEAETPERTEGYEGFYHFMGIRGDVNETMVQFILRDHDRAKLEEKKAYVEKACAFINGKYGEGTATLQMRDSYYNMKELLLPHMEIVDRAKEAMLKAGVTPVIQPIRGGTDGAMLTYKGLLCPNLSTGGANFHGVRELVSTDAMEKMVEVLLNIVRAD